MIECLAPFRGFEPGTDTVTSSVESLEPLEAAVSMAAWQAGAFRCRATEGQVEEFRLSTTHATATIALEVG